MRYNQKQTPKPPKVQFIWQLAILSQLTIIAFSLQPIGCQNDDTDKTVAAKNEQQNSTDINNSTKNPSNTTKIDGSIASLDLIFSSEHSEYYSLAYWSDGLRITGLLGRPRQGCSLPAIIYNRGGNRGFHDIQGEEIIPLVDAGFFTVASHYRQSGGSEGFEQYGGADVDDVMNLIPLLKNFPEVDVNRIGMIGYSRGGMMTYIALKRQSQNGTNDIKAAVVVGGLTDLFNILESRPDMLSVFRDLIGPTPEQAPELYRARSARFWPDLIKRNLASALLLDLRRISR